MYICPTCGKEIETELGIQKHYLLCWKELHPYHKGKSAPKGKDTETKVVSSDIMAFFEGLNK